MGLFSHNDGVNEEESGELRKISAELTKTLGELRCEEAIIKDKERFGRVRMIMMNVLRAEHGEDVANRTLSRVNKRIQEGYLNQ